jgi:hypothetical protein
MGAVFSCCCGSKDKNLQQPLLNEPKVTRPGPVIRPYDHLARDDEGGGSGGGSGGGGGGGRRGGGGETEFRADTRNATVAAFFGPGGGGGGGHGDAARGRTPSPGPEAGGEQSAGDELRAEVVEQRNAAAATHGSCGVGGGVGGGPKRLGSRASDHSAASSSSSSSNSRSAASSFASSAGGGEYSSDEDDDFDDAREPETQEELELFNRLEAAAATRLKLTGSMQDLPALGAALEEVEEEAAKAKAKAKAAAVEAEAEAEAAAAAAPSRGETFNTPYVDGRAAPWTALQQRTDQYEQAAALQEQQRDGGGRGGGGGGGGGGGRKKGKKGGRNAPSLPPLLPRFLAADKGDEAKALARWAGTMAWRQEEGMNRILCSPHRHFEVIKRHFPHYYHGRGRRGEPVYFERSGKIELKPLKAAGVSLDDLVRHYLFITEYLWTYLGPGEAERVITVLDVDGIGLSDVGGEVVDFIRAASGLCGTPRSRY